MTKVGENDSEDIPPTGSSLPTNSNDYEDIPRMDGSLPTNQNNYEGIPPMGTSRPMNSSQSYQRVTPVSQPPMAGIPMTTRPGPYNSNQQGMHSFPHHPIVPGPQYPVPSPHLPSAPGAWSTGLYDFGSDIENCCITCWCPCITFGQIAEILDRGSTSCGTSGAMYALINFCTGCACIYSYFYRSRMRHQYGLEESPCPDLFVHFCCEPCALCQEYRELKTRGFNMNIGWHANVEAGYGGATMPPMMHGGMRR